MGKSFQDRILCSCSSIFSRFPTCLYFFTYFGVAINCHEPTPPVGIHRWRRRRLQRHCCDRRSRRRVGSQKAEGVQEAQPGVVFHLEATRPVWFQPRRKWGNDPITIHNYTPQNSHRPAKRVGRLLSTKNHVFRVYMKIRKVTIIIPDSLRVVLVHVPLVENHLKFFIFCLPPTTSDVALDNLFAGAHKFV